MADYTLEISNPHLSSGGEHGPSGTRRLLMDLETLTGGGVIVGKSCRHRDLDAEQVIYC